MWDPQVTGRQVFSDGRIFSSINRTCERLDVGKTTVYELVKTGKLTKVNVNGKSLITEDSIQALLAEALSQLEVA